MFNYVSWCCNRFCCVKWRYCHVLTIDAQLVLLVNISVYGISTKATFVKVFVMIDLVTGS